MRSSAVIALTLVTLVAWISPGPVTGRNLPLGHALVATFGAAPPSITAIAVGGAHTCAVTSVGEAKCWGWNGSGQLGNGTRGESPRPVDVSGLEAGVSAIAAGDTHTCALIAGAAKCWGSNAYGQLGDGTTTDSYVPVDVSGLASDGVAITAGGIHTCALTTAGRVMCWGHNEDGQLGDGTTIDSSVPIEVLGLSNGITTIATSNLAAHTCALTSVGEAKCWGWNVSGQLGNGTTSQTLSP